MHTARIRPGTASPLQSFAAVQGGGCEGPSGDCGTRRRLAREELARWRFPVPYSIARLLSEMQCGDVRNPMESVAGWLRLNCAGSWRHVIVPGGDGFFCMDDPECARIFRAKFGKLA